MPIAKKIVAAVILAAILCLAAEHLMRYLEWPPPQFSSPDVLNLTKEKTEWEVHYGEPTMCGQTECFLMSGYPAERFERRQVLPVREFPLRGYKQGEVIYYRTTVHVPPHLLRDDDILTFHSLHIWAEKYHFYVNNKLVDIGGKGSLNIPISKSLIGPSRDLTLLLRVDPGKLHYQGLAHMSDVLLGPKDTFAPFLHASHDLMNGFYLWHLIPRLTLCLVFIFFLFGVARDSERFILVLYAFTGALYIYLVSDLPKVVFPNSDIKVTLSPVVNVLSSVLYFAVVHRFFRRAYGKWERVATAVAGLIVLSIALIAWKLPLGRLHEISNTLNYVLRIAGLYYGIYLSTVTLRYLLRTGLSPARVKASAIFLAFNVCVFVVYLCVILRVIPSIYWSSTIFVSDTLLLILFAALVGQEFGTTVLQRDKIKNTFKPFLGAPVVDRLVHGKLSSSGGTIPTEQNATIMFCDVRDFTTMCEAMTPAEVFAFLNQYLDLMVKIISKHRGFIDKFGGDSILAIWGAPELNDRHALDAAACALEMRQALARFNEGRTLAGLSPVKFGIGLHSGPVISGAVGSHERQEYTVLGDTVNTAARIEGLTKVYGTDILLSHATWGLLGGTAVGRALGAAQVKGRANRVEVFTIEALHGADNPRKAA